MQLSQTIGGNLQVHTARRIGFNQADKLPRNGPGRNLFHQTAQRRCRHNAFQQPPDGPARTDIDRADPELNAAFVARLRVQLNVVDAHHFAAMHVDDLLIQQIAIHQQHALGTAKGGPLGRGNRAANSAIDGLHQPRCQQAVAAAGAHHQQRNVVRVLLRKHRHFAHTAYLGAGGVENGLPEQFG